MRVQGSLGSSALPRSHKPDRTKSTRLSFSCLTFSPGSALVLFKARDHIKKVRLEAVYAKQLTQRGTRHFIYLSVNDERVWLWMPKIPCDGSRSSVIFIRLRVNAPLFSAVNQTEFCTYRDRYPLQGPSSGKWSDDRRCQGMADGLSPYSWAPGARQRRRAALRGMALLAS